MDSAGRREATIFLLGLAGLYACALVLAPALSNGSDLFPLWVAGRLFGTGQADHIYVGLGYGLVVNDPVWRDLARAAEMREITAYVQPPWVAAAAAPFAKAVPFATFASLFLAANIAALLAAGTLALARWAPRLGPFARLGALFALLVSGTGFALLHYNQTQCFILLGLVAGLTLAESRPRTAGIAVGLVAAVKLMPVLVVLYWLVSGRTRAALAALATIAVVAGLDLALIPADLNREFVDGLRALAVTLNLAGSNQAPIKLVYAWLAPDAVGPLHVNVGRTIALPPLASAVLNVLATTTAVLLGWWARNRPDGARRDGDALMLIATVPFAPIAWNHYYAAVLLAAIALLGRGTWRDRAAYAAVLVLLSVGTYAVTDTTGLTLGALSNAAAILAAAALALAPARATAQTDIAPAGALA